MILLNKPLFKGIDISKHQTAGKVNFKELKKLGYEFVMLRAGYGKEAWQKDPAFESHYKAAKEAGLKVGAYHYSYATDEGEALQEAHCFLGWIKGKKLDYPVAFDIEDKCHKRLGREQCTNIALAFMTKVEEAGYYTMLYSYSSFIKKYLDMDALKHFDVWIAHYTSNEKNIGKYYKGKYGMWQYSSSVKLPTVYKSRLDHNYAYKDYAEIIKRAKLNNL